MSRGCAVCFGRSRACRCGVVEDDETEFEQVDRTREGLLERAGVLALLRTQEGHPDEAEVIRALVREVRSAPSLTTSLLRRIDALGDRGEEEPLAWVVSLAERQQQDRRVDNEDIARAYDFARDKATVIERGAVVAALRECAMDDETTGAEMRLLHDQALRFERGEHRREEPLLPESVASLRADAARARAAGISFHAVREILSDHLRDPGDTFSRTVERLRDLALRAAEATNTHPPTNEQNR